MNCDSSFDSGQQEKLFFNSMAGSIALDNLSADDRLIIRTKNSSYKFSVINPGQRQGMLSGGRLGDNPRSAVLIECLADDAESEAVSARVLKVGSRALFYLMSARGVERVITSAITDIEVTRGEESSLVIF
jgi:hypothetical protein